MAESGVAAAGEQVMFTTVRARTKIMLDLAPLLLYFIFSLKKL
jgi:hypothetical protein